VPVINALSNREHPVEVLADALTLRELFGDLRGRRLAFLGEGNNICRSLMLLAPLIAMDIAVASPPGYEPDAEIVEQARSLAAKHGTQVQITANPQEAAEGAGVLYTDVWVSIGTEEDAEQRRQRFEPYQVNDDLLKLARPGALVLHCLPARRGEEITASVLDGTRSFAFRRLANLVPVTTAVLYMLLK
jgi:ornithine carbamoyltransferase